MPLNELEYLLGPGYFFVYVTGTRMCRFAHARQHLLLLSAEEKVSPRLFPNLDPTTTDSRQGVSRPACAVVHLRDSRSNSVEQRWRVSALDYPRRRR